MTSASIESSQHGSQHGHGDAGPSQRRDVDVFGRASHAKAGMWVYLCTDAMTFSGLLLAYVLLRTRTPDWPIPENILGLTISGTMTFLLICSSVTMVIAQAKGEARDRRGLLKYLGLTIVGGLIFLSMQAYEYSHLINDWGMTLAEFPGYPRQFAQTFYIVTGFHGVHVFSGVVYLMVIFGRALAGKYDSGDCTEVEVAGLFWHFVDLVWILVFTFLYLI